MSINWRKKNRTPWDYLDKAKNVDNYVDYMLNRTQEMFKWNGLPENIPQNMLELYLQTNGHIGWISWDGKIWALPGGFGGEPDPYYIPVDYIIANPALKIANTFTRDKDVIVMRSDTLGRGLLPILEKYASQLAENDTSLAVCDYNSRIVSLITAGTDSEQKAAQKFIDDIKAGKLTAVNSNAFYDSIKTQPYATAASSSMMKTLMEFHQYLLSQQWIELGLTAPFNMKREAINESEIAGSNDICLPLIDNMLRNRKDAAEKVNNMFGLNISVELASSWDDIHREEAMADGTEDTDAEMEKLANDGNIPEDGDDSRGE